MNLMNTTQCCNDNTYFLNLPKKKKKKSVQIQYSKRLGDWKINININANTKTPPATIPTGDLLLDQNARSPSLEGAVQNTWLYIFT